MPSVVRCLFFFFAFISDFVSRFDFYTDLQNKLQNPAKVVTVFDRVQMHGEKGAVATVDMPPGNFTNKTCETGTFEMFCARSDKHYYCLIRLDLNCRVSLKLSGTDK